MNIRQVRAARALARGATQAAAAREASVDRATIGRWLKLPEFLDLVATASATEEEEGIGEQADKGLARLIPIAEAVVEAALKGEPYNGRAVTTAQHAQALATIKLAHSIEPKDAESLGTPTLHSLIRELDDSEAATRNA